MWSPTRRVTTSVGPPAAKGTITVIGLAIVARYVVLPVRLAARQTIVAALDEFAALHDGADGVDDTSAGWADHLMHLFCACIKGNSSLSVWQGRL